MATEKRNIGKTEQFIATIILAIIFLIMYKVIDINVVICFALSDIIIEFTIIRNNNKL
jgi:hypothetical protein